MKIKISEAEKLSKDVLHKLGFSLHDSELITKNVIDGELVGRKSHGFIRVINTIKQVEGSRINVKGKSKLIKESDTQLYVDGQKKPGFIVLYESLEEAIKKAKKSGIVTVGLKDLGVTGYIGSYARIAAENDLIFIGFNNSPGGLVPHGSIEAIWGTNPLTISVPTKNGPAVLDMASSLTTWGDLMVSDQEGKQVKECAAIDVNGNLTTDPKKAMDGGILPVGGHKGSGIAFMVEMLAGALTGSMVGGAVEGGWGSFYILIDPTRFRPIKDFKKDVGLAIDKLKKSKKAKGIKEIYYPGEKSYKLRQENINSGEFETNEKIVQQLKDFLH